MSSERGLPGQEDFDFTKRAIELLKELRIRHQLTQDNDLSDTQDPRTFLQEQWRERTYPITTEELAELLSCQEFGLKVVEAIRQTDDKERLMQEQLKMGQEFGFVAFRHKGSIEPIHITPLFEGDEQSINLHLQSTQYQEQIDFTGSRTLVFHTHPNIILAYLLESLDLEGIRPQPEHDYFSIGDLKNFRRITEEEDMSLIYALGTKKRNREGGNLLLISFNNFDQFMDFDPVTVLHRCEEYKQTHRGSPLDVYHQFGLNAASLNVNLGSNAPFAPREVKRVSRLLTQRAI